MAKRASGGRKGSPFERLICKQLSEWWTGGKDDSVFWRTGGSGGRGTVRGRKGKKTAGGCGDVCAMDHVGKPLMDLMTLELKRGYSRFTFADLIDQPKHLKDSTWMEWIKQAELSAQNAGSYSWAIIARRDKREAIIAMPDELNDLVLTTLDFAFLAVITCYDKQRTKRQLWVMRLDEFFENVPPVRVQKVLKQKRAS